MPPRSISRVTRQAPNRVPGTTSGTVHSSKDSPSSRLPASHHPAQQVRRCRVEVLAQGKLQGFVIGVLQPVEKVRDQ
jgi:hypothetical protein